MIISDPDVTRADRTKEALRGEVVLDPLPKPAEGIRALLTTRQRNKLELYKAESLSILDRKPLRPVVSSEEASAVAELRARAKIALKELDSNRRSAVDPLNAHVKKINAEFRRWTDPLNTFFKRAEHVLLAWQQHEEARVQREKQDAIRRQEEAAVREAEATAKAQAAKTPKARQKAMQEADAASKDLMVAEVQAPHEPVRGWKGDVGSTSKTERWTFEVVDPGQVPREYCAVDEKLIRKAVREGAREIPGVHIYIKEGLATRVERPEQQ